MEKELNDQKAVAVRKDNNLDVAPINVEDIDSLAEATVAPIDLMSEYWTPDNAGEFKRVIFDRIDITPVLAQDTGEVIDLECAFFFIKEGGAIKQICNGSKRLVGAIQAYNINKGTPLEIKFLGKKQNRTNSFKSDNWSVKPLVINQK